MSSDYAQLPPGTIVPPTPFSINIPESGLDKLSTLLKLSKLSKQTYENTTNDSNFGISRSWLEDETTYWRRDFDWRKHEEHINSFPQFKMLVEADGQEPLKVHFVGLFSKKKDAIPLIFIHGWPEFTPETLPYHTIVPLFLWFAFSDMVSTRKEYNLDNVGGILNQLMVNLGFETGYVAQGGDIGSKMSRILGAKYASCRAVHQLENPISELSETDKKDCLRGVEFQKTGSSYALEHATRPSNIGLILSSNPLALLAWICEKFMEWTDKKPSLDTIIESVALYRLTDTFPSSIYNYRQKFAPKDAGTAANPEYYIPKPFEFSSFAKEIAVTPKAWAATTGDLVFYRRHDSGGHFVAIEKPDILLKDVEDFITQVWTK